MSDDNLCEPLMKRWQTYLFFQQLLCMKNYIWGFSFFSLTAATQHAFIFIRSKHTWAPQHVETPWVNILQKVGSPDSIFSTHHQYPPLPPSCFPPVRSPTYPPIYLTIKLTHVINYSHLSSLPPFSPLESNWLQVIRLQPHRQLFKPFFL